MHTCLSHGAHEPPRSLAGVQLWDTDQQSHKEWPHEGQSATYLGEVVDRLAGVSWKRPPGRGSIQPGGRQTRPVTPAGLPSQLCNRSIAYVNCWHLKFGGFQTVNYSSYYFYIRSVVTFVFIRADKATRTHARTHMRGDWKAICRQKLISVCEIRKRPLWCMVITPSLPPTCIITTTSSHDWWNMRLWNLTCYCYHPSFHLSPNLSLSLNLFCLVQPLCLTKYLSSLQWLKMFGKCTNKK